MNLSQSLPSVPSLVAETDESSPHAALAARRKTFSRARAARTLKSNGSFAGLASLMTYAEINGLLAADLRGHQG